MINTINNYQLKLSQLKKIKKELNRFLIEDQSIKYLNFCDKILKKN